MRSRTSKVAVGLMMAVVAVPVWGQGVSAVPASNPASLTTGPLQIKVVAVQGGAQFRNDGETKWHSLAAGADLIEGVEFRTGPKGTIQFTVGTDQVYRVDRLTVLKVLRASLGIDGTIKTDVGMQYGRVSKDVDAPVRPHDDTIVTPSSTLAVRGTHVSLYDQPPYEPEAVSLTGAAVFSALGHQLSSFGAKGEGTAAVSASNPDAAGNALNGRIVDPSSANARTPDEKQLLADVITNGSVVNINNPITLPTVSDTLVPTDTQLPTLVGGNLVFYIRWDTDTHVQMKLIAAAGPGHVGEFVFPVLGLNRSPSGGQLLFDNLGGPNGGFEVITYPDSSFPNGNYAIGAVNQGPLPTTVTFNAFITDPTTGKLTPQDFLDQQTGMATGKVVQSVAVGQTGAAIAPVDKQHPNEFAKFTGGGGFNPNPPAPPLAVRSTRKKP